MSSIKTKLGILDLFLSATLGLFAQTAITVTETNGVVQTAPTPGFAGPYVYQWYRSGAPISTVNIRTATSQTIQFSALLTDAGAYSVRVSSANGSITTPVFNLSVIAYNAPLQDYSAASVTTGAYTASGGSFSDIPMSPIDNPRGLMDSNGVYHVQASGKYMCVGTVRLDDYNGANGVGCPPGVSWGLGIDTAARDGGTFHWTITNSTTNGSYIRNGANVVRIDTFEQGDSIRLFVYAQSGLQVNGASFSIIRVE